MLIDIERDNKVNICALSSGKQIMLVKTSKDKFENADYVLLYASKSPSNNYNPKNIERFKSGEFDDANKSNLFLLSREGTIYKSEIFSESYDLKYVAEVEYIKINVSKRDSIESFFSELYKKSLFPFWDVEYGPMRRLKGIIEKKGMAYIALYRVYEVKDVDSNRLDKSITSQRASIRFTDVETEVYLKELVSDPNNLSSIRGGYFYLKQKNEIIELAKKYKIYLSFDSSQSESHSNIKLKRVKKDNSISFFKSKKQVILYGPPGTGKTYNSRKIAVDLIDSLRR